MPLSFMKEGESARIAGIGGADTVRKHLGNLGFTVGTVVRVIGDAEGGKIVGVQGSRIALNDELARRINCEPVD